MFCVFLMFLIKLIVFISPSHKLQAYDVQKGVQVSSYDLSVENRAFYGLVQVPMNELIYNLAISNGYSDYEASMFVWLADEESDFDPNVYGYASRPGMEFIGLFQILYPGTWYGTGCTGNITDPIDNILCAFKIYNNNGFIISQWEVLKNR